MTYLLDTHSFLWSAFSPANLGKQVRAAIRNPANDVFVSAVTFWEISLKHALGKLILEGTTPTELPDAAEAMGFDLLPLEVGEAASFHRLDREHHRNPFDRLLIWQAICRRLTLVSRDREMAAYAGQGLRVFW